MKKKIGIILTIAVLTCSLVGCMSSKSYEDTTHHKLGEIEEVPTPVTPTPEIATNETVNKELKVYASDAECNYLVAQNISVLSSYTPKEVVAGVISKNAKCFDKEAKVLGVKVENGIGYVDMNSKFETPNTSSSALGRMKIYSIVNSLCDIKELNISKVVFTLEGQKVDCIAQFDASVPFEYNAELMETHKK